MRTMLLTLKYWIHLYILPLLLCFRRTYFSITIEFFPGCTIEIIKAWRSWGHLKKFMVFSRYTDYNLQKRGSWGLQNCMMRFRVLEAQHKCNNSIGKFTIRAVEILIPTATHFHVVMKAETYLKLNIHDISQPTQSMKSGKEDRYISVR